MPGQVGMRRDLSVIFDGSTRHGEAITIIVRFVDNGWNIIQRLVRIDVHSESVNANKLAEVLNQCLSVDYGVRANSLLATMRDGASVNQAALDRIALVIPTLVEFGSLWIRVFRHSCKAKLLWKDLTGQTARSYSETRRWSKCEVYHQLMVQFGYVERLVEEAKNTKVCPKLLPQPQALSDPQRLMNLKLELAAAIDVGEHFVKATYFLEGDGPLVFACYEKLSAVSQFCQAPCFPNVRAIAIAIAEEDSCQNVIALERSAKACVRPAITWFLRKFNVDLYDLVVTFKAARLFCPVRIQWLKPTNALVDSLRAFPFLDSDTTIDSLKAELPAYLAAPKDVVIPTEEKKVEWWCGYEEQLPR